MKLDRKEILAALETISVAGEGKNMVESGAVQNVITFGDEVVVDLLLSTPALHIKKRAEVDIMKVIHEMSNNAVVLFITHKATTLEKETNIFVMNENGEIETVPYVCADQFTEKPTLLATRSALNAEVAIGDQGPWSQREWSYDQQEACLLLCMTDALGAWLLHRQEQGYSDAFERLSGIRDQQAFLELVEEERASGAMRRDDTTLIIVTLNSLT